MPPSPQLHTSPLVSHNHPNSTVLSSPWPAKESSHTHGRHTPEGPASSTCTQVSRRRAGNLGLTAVLVFADAWTSRWVESKHKSDYGKFVLTAGKFYGDVEKDKGKECA